MRLIVPASTLVVLIGLLTGCASAVPGQALKVTAAMTAAMAAAQSVQAASPAVPAPQPSAPTPEVTPSPSRPPGPEAGMPSAPVAEVGGVPISGIDFQKRVRFEKASMENQLLRFKQLEEQFGNQGYFQTQIAQLETTLASPLLLGTQTLDTMLEDAVIAGEAAARGITVTDEEVDEALNEEIAAARGLVTEAQATATATAAVAATATAAQWTPTPTATPDPNGTPAPIAATLVEPPAAVITGTLLAEGMAGLEKELAASGMSLNEYREIVRRRLLWQKVFAAIGEEKVAATEEQVHVGHILVGVAAPIPAPSGGTGGATDTHGPYPEAEALALANELRSRILAGEDFADLARAYSYDTGSAAYGGDLGWFGKGVMVLPFEEAAFSLPAGQVSEPVRTDFGYHLVKVIEKDPARPKDEARLQQERAEAWKVWVQEQLAGDLVKRAANLMDFMPAGTAGETGTAADPGGAASDGTNNGTNDGPSSGPGNGALPVAVQAPDVPPEWIDGTALGDPNAPLEVQIWADYLCPSCQIFAASIEPQLIEQYVKPGKVRLTLHYFPLQHHDPGATTAARAAACAAIQNRFWPYHWYLMAMTKQAGQAATALEALTAYASAVELDEGAFQSCLVKQEQAEAVAASVAQAYALNLQFVPAVIVGDTLLQDNTLPSLQAAIEGQLHE